MKLNITKNATLYMKKNVKPSTSKSAILNTRKTAIRSPPHMGMGLISPNPSANMSQWKNAKMFPKQNATMFPRMNAKMCPNKYPKRNAAKFPKKWPRKCVVTVHLTRFIEAKDPLSQNLQNIPVPVHPMAVPMPVHPTVHPTAVLMPVHPIAVPMPVHPTVHPMAVPILVHPTKFIKANDQLSQNLQNMVMDQEDILHPPITARLYMKLYMKSNVKLSM